MDLVNRKKVKQTTTNKRKKRRFGLNSEDIDKENSSNDGTNLEDENLPESNSNDNHQMNGTISEAGEESNVAYHIPPLSLLNQPAKQQSTSKSEVQRKGQILESTMKNFGVNAKVKQIKIGPAVTQYEIQPAQRLRLVKLLICIMILHSLWQQKMYELKHQFQVAQLLV